MIEALNKDFVNAAYDSLNHYSGIWDEEDDAYISIEMTYKKPTKDGQTGEYIYTDEQDKNTMEFLKTKGYIR